MDIRTTFVLYVTHRTQVLSTQCPLTSVKCGTSEQETIVSEHYCKLYQTDTDRQTDRQTDVQTNRQKVIIHYDAV